MSLKVSISFTNNNPDTIWNRLKAQLGRDPTHEEAKTAVRKILKAANGR